MSKKKVESKKPAIKKYNINKDLKCDLTNDELLAAGQKLAEANDAKFKLDSEKKSVVSGYGARLKEKDSQIGVLQGIVQNKFEFRKSCL